MKIARILFQQLLGIFSKHKYICRKSPNCILVKAKQKNEKLLSGSAIKIHSFKNQLFCTKEIHQVKKDTNKNSFFFIIKHI